jgi:hypothetical protein
MKLSLIVAWIIIGICFLRGLFVFDMGGSAEGTYPTAGAICLGAATLGASIMAFAESFSNSGK